MPKPTVSGPHFLVTARQPLAVKTLDSLVQIMRCGGAPVNIVITLERVAAKMASWNGDGQPPSWDITCDRLGANTLRRWASDLELADAEKHADLVDELRKVAHAMKQSMADAQSSLPPIQPPCLLPARSDRIRPRPRSR